MKQTPDKSVAAQIRMTDDCTGCAACANVCPAGAITMEPYGQEGFYKPHVAPQVCINCGLCTKTCPQHEFRDKNRTTPACYAAMAPDNIRLKSSSGGVFTLLAEEILRREGVVCGAAFDENWRVHHILVEDEAGLERLRGSKYVQSFISEDIYKQLQSHLEAGRIVLFTGLACQVAGLYNFLRKDYDNLYTVDLVCAYAPSPKVWGQYLNENYALSDIRHISFRDKTTRGWGAWHNTITTTSGVVEENKYMEPYLNRLFKGEHCVNCKFKRLPRPSDITIGDFWRIQDYTTEMDDRKGTSGILVHNEKGERLLKEVGLRFKHIKSMELKSFAWQITVLPHIIPRTPGCRNFFQNIDMKPYNQNAPEAPREARVGITNWWFLNNRGAILTNYALNEMVNALGWEALTINYITPFERANYNEGFVKDFTEKYIKRTRWLEGMKELKELNKDIGTFIVGSDQIFRHFPCHAHRYLYYGKWVEGHNKLLSYAASFAVNGFDSNEFQKNLTRHWLSRFDRHSIRELDGVDIMKNTFGLESTQVLDPVFCIERAKYERMAEKSTEKTKDDFIAYYIMWPTEENKKIIEYVQKKLGVKKAVHLNPPMPVENWLWYIQHARFIITDSFHGACFSLIFNKEFVVIPNPKEHPSRFLSLEQITGLSSRFFYKNKDVYRTDAYLRPIDYTECNEILEKEINRSIRWLKEALEATKEYKLTPEQEVADGIINYLDEQVLSLAVHSLSIERRVKILEDLIK